MGMNINKRFLTLPTHAQLLRDIKMKMPMAYESIRQKCHPHSLLHSYFLKEENCVGNRRLQNDKDPSL